MLGPGDRPSPDDTGEDRPEQAVASLMLTRRLAPLALAWYDRHRRALPWRALPGDVPDPYRVWLSEVMLQQTTVRTVTPYYQAFLQRWPSVQLLAAAELPEVLAQWAGLGYYARARHLHACARLIAGEHGGVFPADVALLRKLPGIGPYTAAAIAAIAFDRPELPVDGNIKRVLARLLAIEKPLAQAGAHLRAQAQTLVPPARAGDFAQALMDLGATICIPREPACERCPLARCCKARGSGNPGAFPVPSRTRPVPLRQGAAFAVFSGQAMLVRSRPLGGLLGGMTELPTTAWTGVFDAARTLEAAPVSAEWSRLPEPVRHVFTHFRLELAVYLARVPASTPAPAGMRWLALKARPDAGLSRLMDKVIAAVLTHLKRDRSRDFFG